MYPSRGLMYPLRGLSTIFFATYSDRAIREKPVAAFLSRYRDTHPSASCSRPFGVFVYTRKIFVASGALVVAGLLVTLGVVPAQADVINSTVSGGALTSTTSAPTLSSVTLNGTSTQSSTGVVASPWSITDARGTGATWTLSVQATDLVSAAGTVDTIARTIPVTALTVTPGAITAGSGADPATNITAPAIALSTSQLALITAAGPDKGSYSLSPSFSLAIPANAYRSNYSGAVGSTAVNPYSSTLTYTIG